jgi:hypothetical protein
MNSISKIALFAVAPLALAACDSKQEQNAEAAGDQLQAETEVQADALENHADAVRDANPNSAVAENRADAMENRADDMRANAENTAQHMERAAEAAADKR